MKLMRILALAAFAVTGALVAEPVQQGQPAPVEKKKDEQKDEKSKCSMTEAVAQAEQAQPGEPAPNKEEKKEVAN
jgi:DNA replication initiation complex subunit (GINS family)